jgi:heme exporter protein D
MIDLGKYAAFILPSYALTLGFFAWVTAQSLLSARRWRREVERLTEDKSSGDAT